MTSEPLATAIGKALHDPVVGSEPTAWGWSAHGACLTLASGRRVVVQRRDRAAVQRILDVAPRLAAAGISVPSIVTALGLPHGRMAIVSEFVPGIVGVRGIEGGTPGDVERAMGSVLIDLRSMETRGFRSDAWWSSTARLAPVVKAASRSLGRTTRRVLVNAAQRLDGERPRSNVSHGDFAPVNLIVGDGCTTLLDLEDVAVRQHPVDAAWWGLMLRHHHPEVFTSAYAAFLDAADLGGESMGRLADVALVRAVQQLADAQRGHRRHARALVQSAVRWVESSHQPK